MKHEEYRLIAGGLTLLVHAALAAVLITSWRFPQKTVQPVTVELWSAAPAKPQGQPRPARPRPHPEPAPAEATSAPLTLDDCVHRALVRNFDIEL